MRFICILNHHHWFNDDWHVTYNICIILISIHIALFLFLEYYTYFFFESYAYVCIYICVKRINIWMNLIHMYIFIYVYKYMYVFISILYNNVHPSSWDFALTYERFPLTFRFNSCIKCICTCYTCIYASVIWVSEDEPLVWSG